LILALFVDAQNHSALGWRQVRADDVAHLLAEQMIGQQSEGLGAMWLKAEGFPNPMDRRDANPNRSQPPSFASPNSNRL
jgi:hypothetical protein